MIMTNELNINQELKQNFLDFSHEANSQRAFADARDGLKPGQRACLWEMFVKGYSSSKPHVKSAKISGGTVASWWPHGTTAIYDTFARMSQPWVNNIPEVDWHGANGSIQISGEPAADRYTEARLAKSTEEGLLQNIKKQNVPMKLNFSEDEEWPEVFPAIYPRLMVNGCQGIGSTIANVWLPHSLDELAASIKEYLATGKIDYNKLAPSFPSGGEIINKDDLHIIYETGKGRVILRGKADIKGNIISITEIPYQVYVEPFIDQVKQLIEKEEIKGISNILNKSNKKQLLIEIECDSPAASVLTQLYAKTDLQKNFNANQYALVGKTPKLLNYKQYLDIYLQHNYDCIKRENQFTLNKSKKRLEIVNGLVKALEDIDNIIKLIKQSDSSAAAVKNLIEKYSFTDNQAKAIVDMKLGRLAHLEKIELNKEQEELTSTIADCEDIINNLSRQKDIYLERFNAFVKKYSSPRKTVLMQALPNKEEKEIEFVEPEKCVVVMTESGTIKRIPQTSFRNQKRNTKGVKTQEDITKSVIRTNTVDSLMVFTNLGNMYRLLVDNIPSGTNTSKGTPISSLIEMKPNEKATVIYSIYKDTDAKYIMFITKQGIAKKSALDEYTKTKKKSGILAINLREGDEIAAAFLVKDEDIIITTELGMSIHISSLEIGATSRATIGIKGITLKDGDSVCSAIPIHDKSDKFGVFLNNGLGKQIDLKELPLQKKAGKGLMVSKLAEGVKIVATAMLSEKDNILIVGNTTSVCLSAKDIPTLGRPATGNQLIKSFVVKSVSKI